MSRKADREKSASPQPSRPPMSAAIPTSAGTRERTVQALGERPRESSPPASWSVCSALNLALSILLSLLRYYLFLFLALQPGEEDLYPVQGLDQLLPGCGIAAAQEAFPARTEDA